MIRGVNSRAALEQRLRRLLKKRAAAANDAVPGLLSGMLNDLMIPAPGQSRPGRKTPDI
jgi:hypothetical protein